MMNHIFLSITPVFLLLLMPLTGQSETWQQRERQFAQPSVSRSSRPLWFWNTVPTKEETRTQVKACAEKGYAGLAILPAFDQKDMKFMSPEFLEQYRAAADAAKEFGLKLCLYDEFWFPSGSAGGLVREKHPEHLCKRLDMLSTAPDENGLVTLKIPDGVLMGCVEMNTKTFARRNITSAVKDGILQWQRPDGDPYRIMAFVCVVDGQRNLVDYLEPESMKVFVELTYAAYQKTMPEHFGTTIDSAFYDEPMLYTPGNGRAWTPKFNEYFEKRFGYDPVPLYPAMFMEIGPDTASARNALFGFRATLFSEGFVKTITDWLKPYGVPLTGHLDQEEVVNPTGVTGDAIRFFEYQPIPGLDQIFRYGRGSRMYKLISSAAANYDRHLVMTEVYGATANMPVENLYREVMDQAVKGVNMFVPHAVWYDSKGPRTMPPDLSPRDDRYGPELPEYNRYVGRLHTILQQPGSTVTDVALLYPIESLQATYHFGGPYRAYTGGVASPEDHYMRLGEYLSFSLRRDFTYLHPETLLKRCTIEPGVLKLNNAVNPVEFRTILLPTMKVIGVETLRKIRDFYRAGGTVVAVGRLPSGAAERGKDAEVAALLEEIFGKETVEQSRKNTPPKPKAFTVEASSEWAPGGFSPQSAFDGKLDTRWNSLDRGGDGQWLKLVFPEPVEVARAVLCEPFERVQQFQIQSFDEETKQWVDRFAGEAIDQYAECPMPPFQTKELRFRFQHPKSLSVSLSEIDVFDSRGNSLLREGRPSLTVRPIPSGGNGFVIHDDPVKPLSRAHGMLRTVLRIGGADVEFENEDSLPIGSSTGSFCYMHRVIDGRAVYLFTNSTSEPVNTKAVLRNGSGKRFSWWHPHTGSVTTADVKAGTVPLRLAPLESKFLIGGRPED